MPEKNKSEQAIRSGRLSAMHNTNVVAKKIRKFSVSHPSPVRGTDFVGSKAAMTTEASAVAPNSPNNRALDSFMIRNNTAQSLLLL